ncbi:MAG TPA: hypothetical protein VMT86_02495 [Bryobacteraceae bacterium]|nr:hypothetical protein [Bryobacteraceae bacterium]
MLSLAHESDAPLPAPPQQLAWTIISGLVHDIRQPLSVIEACADYLDLILPVADGAARCQLQLLQQQVTDANRILHEALLQTYEEEAPAMHAAAGG